MTSSSPNIDFASQTFLQIIVKHFKTILLFVLLAAVVSAVVSLILPNYYKSTVVMFATSSTAISKALLSEQSVSKDILSFGEEEQAEQLLQVLQSDEIRQRIVEKYNLMEHYEIDPESKFPATAIAETFYKNISFRRTRFMSVEIEVLDTDPTMAADIANNIAALLDTAMNRMQKERARKALSIVEREFINLQNQIKKLEDSLTIIRSKGVQDYETQSEVFNDAYAQCIARGDKNGAAMLEEKLKILSQYGGAYVSIRDFLEYEKKQLSAVKAKYVEAKVDAEQELPHKFIVNSAKVAEKKSYPIRWLIVLASSLSTLLFTIIGVIIFEYIRQTDWRAVLKKTN